MPPSGWRMSRRREPRRASVPGRRKKRQSRSTTNRAPVRVFFSYFLSGGAHAHTPRPPARDTRTRRPVQPATFGSRIERLRRLYIGHRRRHAHCACVDLPIPKLTAPAESFPTGRSTLPIARLYTCPRTHARMDTHARTHARAHTQKRRMRSLSGGCKKRVPSRRIGVS